VLQERERIGMDLHDGAIQALYGVGLRLDACLPAVEGEVREDIDKAIEDINAIIRNIRSYIFDLRLEPSEGRSFRESLQQLLFDLSVNTLISAELVIDDEHLDEDPPRDLVQKQRDELFRIAQEALTNVRKHSHAKNVRAEVTADDGEVRLQIVDDGVGITEEIEGEGLSRMRTMARSLGGDCRVCRGRERGTVVTVTVPMELDGEAA
jgi:signal transduction histidine kinase